MSDPESTALDTVPVRQGYDRWAAVYDTDGNPLIALEEPVVDRLLGPVRGQRVLDLGCGTGRHALRLAAAGASVVGVDFSDGMLARARSRPGADGVAFVCADATAPLPLAPASFDAVVCGLVLEHVRDLGPAFGQMAALCRPGGRVVVTDLHPALRRAGVQARFVDPTTGHKVQVDGFAHGMSEYLEAAAEAGLVPREVEERAVGPDLVARLPRAEPHAGRLLLAAFRFGRLR